MKTVRCWHAVAEEPVLQQLFVHLQQQECPRVNGEDQQKAWTLRSLEDRHLVNWHYRLEHPLHHGQEESSVVTAIDGSHLPPRSSANDTAADLSHFCLHLDLSVDTTDQHQLYDPKFMVRDADPMVSPPASDALSTFALDPRQWSFRCLQHSVKLHPWDPAEATKEVLQLEICWKGETPVFSWQEHYPIMLQRDRAHMLTIALLYLNMEPVHVFWTPEKRRLSFSLRIQRNQRQLLTIPHNQERLHATFLRRLFVCVFPLIDAPKSLDMATVFREILPNEQRRSCLEKAAAPLRTRFPELYPFQLRTLAFLLAREGVRSEVDQDSLQAEGEIPWHPKYVHFLPSKQFVNFVDCQTSYQPVPVEPGWGRIGGVLSEEMGLGKTVEILSLIRAHRRPDSLEAPEGLLRSGATIIVSPSAIVRQWEEEILMHAPELKYCFYDGTGPKQEQRFTKEQLANDFDVILTTYDVFRRDIHYARGDHSRSRRAERKYEWTTTPLVEIHWWRLCADEAQMVESVNSTMAEMAARIPCAKAWAVTGTPVGNQKSSFKDLVGLFSFLGLSEFAKMEHHSPSQLSFLRHFMIRNSKASVAYELKLAPQWENLVVLRFTSVEQHFYGEMREQIGKEWNGTSDVTSVWKRHTEELRLSSALLRLRQACCHPQIGQHNRRIFGNSFLSISDVLAVMLRQCEATVFSTRRQIAMNEIEAGIAREARKDLSGALETYEKLIPGIEKNLDIIREDFRKEQELQEERAAERAERDLMLENLEDETGLEEDEEHANKANDRFRALKSRLPSWLALFHRVLFCLASVYLAKEDTEKSDALFAKAEAIRKEMMEPAEISVKSSIARLKAAEKKLGPREAFEEEKWFIPINKGIVGGIQSRDVIGDINRLINYLNEQGAQMAAYRKRAMEIIQLPLQDKDYSTDAIVQSLGYEYQDLYDFAVGSRKLIVMGRSSLSVAQRQQRVRDQSRRRRGTLAGDVTGRGVTVLYGVNHVVVQAANVHSALAAEDVETPEAAEVPPPPIMPPDTEHSLKSLLHQLRQIEASTPIRAEKLLCADKIAELSKILDEQTELVGKLEKEVVDLSRLWNRRLLFYRILQRLSDEVALPEVLPPVEGADESDVELLPGEKLVYETQNLRRALEKKEGRMRYLKTMHDRDQNGEKDKSQDECMICRLSLSESKVVLVTPCGHMFCEGCIREWAKIRSLCPTCNQRFVVSALQRVVTSSAPLATAPAIPFSSSGASTSTSHAASLATHLSRNRDAFPFPPINQLPAINGNFGTKITAMVKHIRYLTDISQTVKCLVYSQWEDMLDLMERACKLNDIGSIRFSTSGGSKVKEKSLAPIRFKNDPNIRVFLLNARSQAAGLTLVAATHVFLVEPCSNPAIEMQASGRVHRLGQKNETWIHRYIVENTVEEDLLRVNYEKRHDAEDVGRVEGPVNKAHLGKHGEDLPATEVQQILLNDLRRGGIVVVFKQENHPPLPLVENRKRAAEIVIDMYASDEDNGLPPAAPTMPSSSRKRKAAAPVRWNNQDKSDT